MVLTAISDLEWVQAIAATRVPVDYAPDCYQMVSADTLAEHLGIRPNRVRSKARRAYRRGLSAGCICGCRGDFELTDAGEELLARQEDSLLS